jgi:signal transduction histidine kinase/ligand-binding sensor domain-containing protein
MSVPRFLCLAVVFAAVAPIVTAAPPSSWSVDVWQSDDGLPNNNVASLAQTSDGHLWIANSGELARFDGVQFEEFPSRELTGGDQKPTSLLYDRAGHLWLGMDHGALVRLDGKSVRVIAADLPNLIAWSLIDDDEGGIWIVYGGNTIARWTEAGLVRFNEQNGLGPRPRAGCSLARDVHGAMWLATGGELHRFEHDRFVKIADIGDPDAPIRIIAARAGGLWVCSGFRVLRYSAKDHRLESVGSIDARAAEPTALLEDHEGGLWVGTSSSGLFHRTPNGFEPVSTSHARISALLVDREDNIWVGTRGGGLNRIRPRAIDVDTLGAAARGRQAVQSVCEAADGSLWATTEDGTLLRRSGNTWSVMSADPLWPGGRATCLSADGTGGVWIGTRNSRIYQWRDNQFTAYDRAEGLTSHVFHAMLADDDGGVWIGGEVPDNVFRLHDGRVETCAVPAGIRIIRAITRDTAGNVWVGTSKGILLRLAAGKVTDMTAATTREPVSIRCLYSTPDGSVWIGYVGGGVGRYKRGQFGRITRDQGLFDDVVSQIVSDGQGWLWFGAEHGIFKVRERELEDVATGRAVRVRSIHYGRDAGLPSLQANAGDAPGAVRTRDGRLWIALRTGLAVVDPTRLRENPAPPAVLLKRVTVDERPVAAYGGIVPIKTVMPLTAQSGTMPPLRPAYRRLQFDFAAMTFGAPETVHFRYRLIGFDDDWVDAGTARHASYSRLPAGDYRFEAAACNSNGIWSATAATLAFSVAPFFWQTWWFRLAALALFTSAVAGTGRYVSFRRLRAKVRELQQKAALHQERARIAKDIHDDLGGTLTQIILQLDVARRHRQDTAKTETYLQQLSTTTRDAVQSLDEIVWAANPNNDVLSAFVDYLGQFAVEYLQMAGIRCRFDLPVHPAPWPLAPEVRHNLYLVLKEALTNVVRHAHAKEVRLQITCEAAELTMRISDDGEGFDHEPNEACANGVANMRQRMMAIGGHLGIESKKGVGTVIVATVTVTEGC